MIKQRLTGKEAAAEVIQARVLMKRAMTTAKSAINSITEAEYAMKQAETFIMQFLDSQKA